MFALVDKKGPALTRRWWNLRVSVVLLGALLGCGDGRPALVPVSGQVLIDGQPLTNGFIRFAAAGNRPSMGKIGEDGRFTLTCYETGDGAVVGTHQVAIMSQERISDDQYKWHAPKKYSNYANSGVTQEITGPTDSLVIELTWGNERPSK
jgi:hypothetical protein